MYKLDPNLQTLLQKTGYNIVQENGQRRTGPPPFWTGNPPPRGCEIFIGKIPRNVYEDELFPLFQTAGMIYEFRLMMDFSCSNRGFAFATYTNKSDAQRAIKLLNDFEIRPGRRIGVLKSVDNCKLYIGGLPVDKTKEDIYLEISRYTTGVANVVVMSNKIKNQNFAFVEYESHRAASMARKVLIPGNVKLFDMEITVDWATPEPDSDETDKLESVKCTSNGFSSDLVTIIFARNIPIHINEGYLLYVFSLHGCLSVLKVKKIKDFAFVHYFTRQEAEIAMNKLNGMNLSGSVIEVTWAKPKTHALQVQLDKLCLSDSTGHPVQTPICNRDFLCSSRVKILSQICQENAWGEPVFQVIHSSTADEIETIFMSKVYIPYFPQPAKQFTPSTVFYSPKEAKEGAADCALRTIAHLYNAKTFSEPTLVATSERNYFSEIVNYGIKDASPLSNVWNSIQDVSTSKSNEYKTLSGPSIVATPGQNYFPEVTNYGHKEDASPPPSVWNPLQDIFMPKNDEFLNQENFYNLLASAASLANVELQSKKKIDQPIKSNYQWSNSQKLMD